MDELLSRLVTDQIIYKIGGTISCVGSGYIIQDVLRHPERRSKSVYHRIMVGLSSMDILTSFFGLILGSLPMPKGSWPWAIGNLASCDAVAFIGILGSLGSPLYNCSLATCYLLKLKYNCDNDRIKQIEKWFHIVPWSLSILYCIVALSTKTVGPGVGVCGLAKFGYPFGCANPGSEVECIRGGKMINKIFLLIGFSFPLICMLFVAILMFLVYRAVRKVEMDALKHNMSVVLGRPINTRKAMKRSRRVMIQGILYSAAMILTWIFPFIDAFIYVITKERNEVIEILGVVFFPLQGFFNLLIYKLPLFRRMLKTYRQKRELKKGKDKKVPQNEEEKKQSNTRTPHSSSSAKATAIKENKRKSSENSDNDDTNIFSIIAEVEKEKQEIAAFDSNIIRTGTKECNDNEENISIEDQIIESGISIEEQHDESDVSFDSDDDDDDYSY